MNFLVFNTKTRYLHYTLLHIDNSVKKNHIIFLSKVGHTTERPCISIGIPLSPPAPQVIYPTSLNKITLINLKNCKPEIATYQEPL